jgi:hypothetical protein
MSEVVPSLDRETDASRVADPLTCDTGQCHFSAWNEDPKTLVAGCCVGDQCQYLTACIGSGDVTSVSASSTDVLTWWVGLL